MAKNPFFNFTWNQAALQQKLCFETVNEKYVVFVTSEKRLSSRSNKCRGAIYFGVKIRT